MRKLKASKTGYIMLQTLLVMAGLVALVATFAASEEAHFKNVQLGIERRKADLAAYSAVVRAEAVLFGMNTNEVTSTTTDNWSQLGNGSLDSFKVSNGGTFRFQILDAGSLLNINTATTAQLTLLPLTTEQVDCLVDWRSASTTSTVSDGAKDDYYNALPKPYNTRLGNLLTVDELLLVKYWTAQTLYSTPTSTPSTTDYPTDSNQNYLPLANILTTDSGCPNTTASGSTRTNFSRTVTQQQLTRMGVSSRMAMMISMGGSYSSFARLLRFQNMSTSDQAALLNNATFSSATRLTGKINVNTATLGVLMTIPGMTEAAAGAIVDYQTTGFTELGQVATLTGMTQDVLEQVADSLTIGSDTWVVRVAGKSGDVTSAFEVVIGIRNSKVQIINMNRLNTVGIPTWWNWKDETTNTYQAGDAGEQS
jgi:general secretion pathway protein K